MKKLILDAGYRDELTDGVILDLVVHHVGIFQDLVLHRVGIGKVAAILCQHLWKHNVTLVSGEGKHYLSCQTNSPSIERHYHLLQIFF